MDSDFDIDEDEEVADDGADDDDDKKPRRGRIVTKAYVDPKSRKPGGSKKIALESRKRKRTASTSSLDLERKIRKIGDEESDSSDTEEDESSSGSETEEKPKKESSLSPSKDIPSFEPKPYEPPAKRKPGRPRRSSPTPAKIKQVAFMEMRMHEGNRVRSSTKLKSQETESRLKERKKVEARRREKFRSRKDELAKAPPLTQEDLLREAEETAKLNIESLGVIIEQAL